MRCSHKCTHAIPWGSSQCWKVSQSLSMVRMFQLVRTSSFVSHELRTGIFLANQLLNLAGRKSFKEFRNSSTPYLAIAVLNHRSWFKSECRDSAITPILWTVLDAQGGKAQVAQALVGSFFSYWTEVDIRSSLLTHSRTSRGILCAISMGKVSPFDSDCLVFTTCTKVQTMCRRIGHLLVLNLQIWLAKHPACCSDCLLKSVPSSGRTGSQVSNERLINTCGMTHCSKWHGNAPSDRALPRTDLYGLRTFR